MITHFWYRFGRTNSLEDVKVFLMSLWVLIRKDEERMSYAENYFFFNSMSKRKIRLGEIICKVEKSKSRNLFCLLFRENATKVWFLMNVGVIIYLVVWGGCENNRLSWLETLLVSLAGFFILFSAEKIRQLLFFLIQTLSRKASGSIFLHPGVSSSLGNWFDPSPPADFSF